MSLCNAHLSASQIARTARAIRGERLQRVTVACLPAFAHALMPQVVRNFRSIYPDASLKIHSLEETALTRDLLSKFLIWESLKVTLQAIRIRSSISTQGICCALCRAIIFWRSTMYLRWLTSIVTNSSIIPKKIPIAAKSTHNSTQQGLRVIWLSRQRRQLRSAQWLPPELGSLSLIH